MKLAVFFCIFCMFAVYSAQSASLYRWVDADGKVHYTDQPPPPNAAKRVEEKKIHTRSADDVQLPYATRLAAKNFPVTLFNSDCGEVCTKARAHLAARGIPFGEKNASSPEVAEELRKLVGGLVVPVLVVGRAIRLKGYEAAAWDAALDEAGYPRSAPAVGAKQKAPAPAEAKGGQQSATGGGEGKR